jgi:hypothetical protein
MNPYSHLVIAAQLENDIQPANREDYYWGAVAPDVRYTAGVLRGQTHLPPEDIVAFFGKYPHLESFIQGYLVHTVTDLLKFRALLEQRILLWPILLIVSGRFSTVLLETYYIEKMPLRVEFSGAPNPILRDLRIADEHVFAFKESLRPFAAAPSFGTALGFLRALRPGSQRVDAYARAAGFIEQHRYLKSLLFRLADIDKLNRQMLAALRNDEILKATVFKPAQLREV